MLPIELCCATPQKTSHVRAIESFALHDVGFHPEYLFRRAKFYRHSENLGVACTREPRVVHFAETVAGAKNKINKIFAAPGFGQPARVRLLSLITEMRERIQRKIDVPFP